MPRTCTICQHEQRAEIDKRLIASEPLRNVAVCFGTSVTALHRHKRDHIRALLAQAQQAEQAHGAALHAHVAEQQAEEQAHALDVMAELKRVFARVNLLFDACDRWLRDPDNPDQYDLRPRAEDVWVIFEEANRDGRSVRKKARLSELLNKANSQGRTVERGEYKHADPRELVLKTAERLQGHLELLAKLLGELDERPQVNVLVAPEWLNVRTALLSALIAYPEARAAVTSRLLQMEGRQ